MPSFTAAELREQSCAGGSAASAVDLFVFVVFEMRFPPALPYGRSASKDSLNPCCTTPVDIFVSMRHVVLLNYIHAYFVAWRAALIVLD